MAADILGIPALRTHILPKLEAYLTGLLVDDDDTGSPCEDASIAKFVQALEIIYTVLGEHETAVREVLLRLCLKHYTALEKNERFCALTDAHPPLLRDMLGHAARHSNTIAR